MKHDEFSFFNRQLAAMLREGIPLEGALRQLSAGMRDGVLKLETEALEKDLATGTPLATALEKRKLPDLYKNMVRAGAAGDDLPGMLTLLADHYERANLLWTRLAGLMVYPVIVVTVALVMTLAISIVFTRFLASTFLQHSLTPPLALTTFWAPPVLLALALGAALAITLRPRWRAVMRWQFPGFREASLAQFASAMALMLRNNTPLPQALALAEGMEPDSPALGPLREWRRMTESGAGKPAQWPVRKPFPPLFFWLLKNGGDDLASGFAKAAEIYQGRASYRIEMLLYGALPVSILLLGMMIIWQATPLMQSLLWLMNTLGSMGD